MEGSIEVGKEIDMDVDNRVVLQEGKEAIGNNPIMALIELITNSLDSYYRMKKDNKNISEENFGKLDIVIVRKRKGKCKIGVKDWAEGMSQEEMIDFIHKYGKKTSGKDKYKDIRGYFGRGLKDAVVGLGGRGIIVSRKNKKVTRAEIYVKNKSPKYKVIYNKPVSDDLLEEEGLGCGKTIVLVQFETEENKTMPRFDKFAEQLTLAVPLREAMKSGKIKLMQKDNEGNTKRQQPLKYKEPDHTVVYQKNNIRIETTTFDLILKKAEHSLQQSGMCRTGGLLIRSGNTIHESTLFKFDDDPAAQKFFGEVRCDYLDKLINQEEPVILGSRRGLNRKYPFINKLKEKVEEKIEPFIQEEKKEKRKKRKIISDETRERTKKVRNLLNKFADDELEEIVEGHEKSREGDKVPAKPPNGFGFIPPYYKIKQKQSKKILLRAETPSIIPSYSNIEVSSSNENIIIENKEYNIGDSQINDEHGIANIRIDVKGEKPYEKGEIVAQTKDKEDNTRKAIAQVEVVPSEQYPNNGFEFIPSSYRIKVQKKKKIKLKIDTNLIDEEKKIEVTSDHEDIHLPKQELKVNPEKGVIEKGIKTYGEKENIKGKIIAKMGSKQTEATVKITSKTPRPRKSGIIKDINYDTETPEEDVIQRVSYANNEITVYTNDKSISKYFQPTVDLEGDISCQLICAELFLEAFCNMLAQEKERKGEIIDIGGNKIDAYQREINSLKKKYGQMIHDNIVNDGLLKNAKEK